MQSPPILLILTLVVGLCLAGCVQTTTTDGNAVQPGQIKNLVTFGDSYTDPAAEFGGHSWAAYVAEYESFNLYCASSRCAYGRVYAYDRVVQRLQNQVQHVPTALLTVPFLQSRSTNSPPT